MLRLRQIALVARELEPVEDDFRAILGLEVCYRDPGVGRFGLHNFLMPIGNAFLEVVAPIEEGTAGGRYLDRRGGDGGYMVIMQTDDVASARERVLGLGVRLVLDSGAGANAGIQLHPKDVAGPWGPAGPDWRPAQRLDVTRRLTAAEIQSPEPEALAARWSEVLARPIERGAAGPELALDDATLRFVEAADGRGEGLGGLDVEVADREHVLREAESRGRRTGESALMICGTRFNLV
jgi:hypothetical protein